MAGSAQLPYRASYTTIWGANPAEGARRCGSVSAYALRASEMPVPILPTALRRWSQLRADLWVSLGA
jgi:hypothetical protein